MIIISQELELALRSLRWTAATCKNKGLSWTIETVINWYPEFLKVKRPGVKDNTPQAVKDLGKGIGDTGLAK